MFPIRINKFLSAANYCSRRQADRFIEERRVKINNEVAKLGDQVRENDRIFVDDEKVKLNKKEKVYLAFNKPVGIICTTDKKSPDNIVDYINYPERIYPIGRLDVKSSGLIILTNDGSIVNKILKAREKIEKEYLVEVDRELTDNFLKHLCQGMVIEGYKTLPAKIKKLSARKFLMTISEGKNRQIRKMCEEFGFEVINLTRIRIGRVKLDNLPLGKWRKINKYSL